MDYRANTSLLEDITPFNLVTCTISNMSPQGGNFHLYRFCCLKSLHNGQKEGKPSISSSAQGISESGCLVLAMLMLLTRWSEIRITHNLSTPIYLLQRWIIRTKWSYNGEKSTRSCNFSSDWRAVYFRRSEESWCVKAVSEEQSLYFRDETETVSNLLKVSGEP